MVEPPGEARIAAVAEVDHHVLVAVEAVLGEDLAELVSEPLEDQLGLRVHLLEVEAREDGGGREAVETAVVVEHFEFHKAVPWDTPFIPWTQARRPRRPRSPARCTPDRQRSRFAQTASRPDLRPVRHRSGRRDALPGVRRKSGIPWERRRSIGRWRGLFRDAPRERCSIPTRPSARCPTSAASEDPLRYDLITQYISGSVPTVAAAMSFASPQTTQMLNLIPQLGFTPHQLAIGTLLLYPLAGPVGVLTNLFLASLSHGAFRFMGIGKGGFARTYAAMAYGSSAAVLNVTVFLSSLLIPQLWEAYSTVIGFRHAHRTSTFKATTALMVPELMLIILVMTIIGMTFAIEAVKTSLAIPSCKRGRGRAGGTADRGCRKAEAGCPSRSNR